MSRDISKIADAWVKFVRRTNPMTGDLSKDEYNKLSDGSDWAVDELMDMSYDDAGKALDVIYEISKYEDPWVLENLGAGPLETLLSNNSEFIITEMNKRGLPPEIRQALLSVWSDSMSEGAKEFLKSAKY